MITSPITTPHFHSRVLALLSNELSQAANNGYCGGTEQAQRVVIPPLVPADTPLTPDEFTSQIVGVTSSWTDLCSPDPTIASLSEQILKLEVEYAAFCGITYLIIPGPRLHSTCFHDGSLLRYARAILDALSAGPYLQIQLWIPLIEEPNQGNEEIGDLAPFARQLFFGQEDQAEKAELDLFRTWEAWDTIRSLCKYHNRLCVALSLPKLLPPAPIQSRWQSEPVRILTLTGESFTRNPKGNSVLPKAHQAFLTRFMRLRTRPWILLCDVGPLPALVASTGDEVPEDRAYTNPAGFPTPADAFEQPQQEGQYKGHSPHLAYLRYLQNKQPQQSQIERFGAGYQDYLQAPLQPLTVNLESITYEVFEKDPVKYDWYEKATARALHDWLEQGKPTSNPDGKVVVAVVGAGRGPLVTRALKAAEDVDVEIEMWALEKNQNAFVLLQRHNQTVWGNQVNLVRSDMRTWAGPVKHVAPPRPPINDPDMPIGHAVSQGPYTGDADVDRDYLLATAPGTQPTHYPIDILISELLGSFADNELSPECLDGVQQLLNPTHGISIPASYTAHLTPIAAPKLHADILNQSQSNLGAPEIPYVVMLHAMDFLSTITALEADISDLTITEEKHSRPISAPPPPPEPLVKTAWSFSHPNPAIVPTIPPTNAHNARHSTLSFPIPNRGTCHGIAGYFETVLYQKVELSTNPATMNQKSEGMISWFPIYFPLRTPLYVPDGGELVVSMWRRTDDRRVWYEWFVEAFVTAGGGGGIARRIKLGSSELHSSIKEACLM